MKKIILKIAIIGPLVFGAVFLFKHGEIGYAITALVGALIAEVAIGKGKKK